MKEIKILESFEREIGKLENSIEKPSTDTSLFWINQAVSKFIKLRFNGDFIHKTSYEQNEKRRNDLINLYSIKEYNNTNIQYKDVDPSYDEYYVKYPRDFMYVLNEDVIISDTEGKHKMNTTMFECTSDSFMYRVNNSLTDFHYRYHRARPLRVRDSEGCKLLTDRKYKISKYTLGYLRKPKEITLQDPFNEYTDFEDIVIPEIVKMAAQMYLENTGDKRYQTITQEVSTQE